MGRLQSGQAGPHAARTPAARRRRRCARLRIAARRCGGASGWHERQRRRGYATITLYSGQHQQLYRCDRQRVRKADRHPREGALRRRDRAGRPDPAGGLALAADVYLTENSPELMLLTGRNLLAKLPASITSQVPSQYNSPTGELEGYLGTGERAGLQPVNDQARTAPDQHPRPR